MDDDLINFKQVYGVSASNLFLYEYENKFRKCAVLVIENGDKCKIVKEK